MDLVDRRLLKGGAGMVPSKKCAKEVGREVGREALQELSAKARLMDAKQPAAGPWISVEDALPKEKATCLTLYSDGGLEIHIGASIAVLARWAKKHDVDVCVTHWAEVMV